MSQATDGDFIEVGERSTSPVSREVYLTLESSQDFSELVAIGAASLVRSRTVPYGVRASAYVGEALLDNKTRIRLREKIPGTVNGLIRWALSEDLRSAPVPSPSSVGSDVLGLLAQRFLHHLSEYLRQGRMKEYVQRLHSSSFPIGRIDLAATAKLFARGRKDRLAYWHSDLSADNLPNRLLALGLRAVEVISVGGRSKTNLELQARRYAVLFEDVGAYSIADAPWQEKAREFENALLDDRVTGHLRQALAYARALVLHLGGLADVVEATKPHLYLLNLETLFEDACRTALRDALPSLFAESGRIYQRKLFAEQEKRYIADPDIVLGNPMSPVLVADCKYKVLDGAPEHSDVYQILAHCDAFNSKYGLLLYPGEAREHQILGFSRNQVQIHWATVRPKVLQDDLAAVVSSLLHGIAGSAPRRMRRAKRQSR